MQIFDLVTGSSPFIISIPHAGLFVPEEIKQTMRENALTLPDTDWYVDRLYSFAEHLDVTIIKANYSRYVIDLNRDCNDVSLYPGQFTTSLCPVRTFEDKPVYLADKEPAKEEIAHRISRYWQPYHDEIQQLIERALDKHGFALMLDAHSIASVVPTLFTGKLPDFNLGTNGGKSCGVDLTVALGSIDFYPYSKIVNGRFKGGHITRHYGGPDKHVYTVQLELSQATYMNESSLTWSDTRSERVTEKLKLLVSSLLNWCELQSNLLAD